MTNLLTSAPRGTKDILPATSGQWQELEKTIRQLCGRFGYQEIRTPVFEHTELFIRGIGETTDVVEKEMYTFTDRGERSLTLRPENTASVVRAYLENKLYGEAEQPTKLFYMGPMFRYDRPQAGRYRQFHQFGVEVLGAAAPTVDAEAIALAMQLFQGLGLVELTLFINSVGCPVCRPAYREQLQNYLRPQLDSLCPDCKSRFDRNPMRILDCKNEACRQASQGAPQMLDCLCEECHDHFTGLKSLLDAADIPYQINTNLVRGLDYYTKTAFEIQYAPLGAQSAVCGGGRYDGLVGQCGGPDTPGIGFAVGLERLLLALEKQGLLPSATRCSDAFIAPLGKEQTPMAFALLLQLRKEGLTADMDFLGRSLKAQLKQANRQKARFALLLGEEECATQQVQLKNLETGEQRLVSAQEAINAIKEEMGE